MLRNTEPLRDLHNLNTDLVRSTEHHAEHRRPGTTEDHGVWPTSVQQGELLLSSVGRVQSLQRRLQWEEVVQPVKPPREVSGEIRERHVRFPGTLKVYFVPVESCTDDEPLWRLKRPSKCRYVLCVYNATNLSVEVRQAQSWHLIDIQVNMKSYGGPKNAWMLNTVEYTWYTPFLLFKCDTQS